MEKFGTVIHIKDLWLKEREGKGELGMPSICVDAVALPLIGHCVVPVGNVTLG